MQERLLMQKLKQKDHLKRQEFVTWMLQNQEVNGVFSEKSSLAMKRTFNWTGTSKYKIVGFVVQRTLYFFMRLRCINELMFVAYFGLPKFLGLLFRGKLVLLEYLESCKT